MSIYGMDTLRESPPPPLLQRGEFLRRVSKGSSFLQREDRRDSTARLQRDHMEITP